MTARANWRAVIRGLIKASLVPAAALAVHQLRYVLAFGGNASLELERQGHSYLHSLVPWIVLLIGVAVGGFLCSLGRALSGETSAPRFTLSLAGLWLVCSICLITIYITQELLEGLFLTGHPAGLAGVFGYGGWWAIPVAACIGLVLAAFFHGARWVLEEVARRAGGISERPPRPLAAPRPPSFLLPRLSPLAEGWSGRGPPR
jgi:hypothetical protein